MSVHLTRDQVRRIDRVATERFKMPSLLLMENAGRSAAAIIRSADGTTGRAVICCGTGNNGGDGCVIARHLHNADWTVRVMITGDASRMTDDTRTNYAILDAMNVETRVAGDPDAQDRFVSSIRDEELVIDALLGTGFRGEVRSPTAELIQALNAATKQALVAVDVPSGLDCDTGEPSNATVCADLTVTFVAAKTGFAAPAAAAYLGRIEVADIGTPRELLAEVSTEKA